MALTVGRMSAYGLNFRPCLSTVSLASSPSRATSVLSSHSYSSSCCILKVKLGRLSAPLPPLKHPFLIRGPVALRNIASSSDSLPCPPLKASTGPLKNHTLGRKDEALLSVVDKGDLTKYSNAEALQTVVVDKTSKRKKNHVIAASDEPESMTAEGVCSEDASPSSKKTKATRRKKQVVNASDNPTLLKAEGLVVENASQKPAEAQGKKQIVNASSDDFLSPKKPSAARSRKDSVSASTESGPMKAEIDHVPTPKKSLRSRIQKQIMGEFANEEPTESPMAILKGAGDGGGTSLQKKTTRRKKEIATSNGKSSSAPDILIDSLEEAIEPPAMKPSTSRAMEEKHIVSELANEEPKGIPMAISVGAGEGGGTTLQKKKTKRKKEIGSEASKGEPSSAPDTSNASIEGTKECSAITFQKKTNRQEKVKVLPEEVAVGGSVPSSSSKLLNNYASRHAELLAEKPGAEVPKVPRRKTKLSLEHEKDGLATSRTHEVMEVSAVAGSIGLSRGEEKTTASAMMERDSLLVEKLAEPIVGAASAMRNGRRKRGLTSVEDMAQAPLPTQSSTNLSSSKPTSETPRKVHPDWKRDGEWSTEQPSFEKVRIVKNTVDKASLREITPSTSFDDMHLDSREAIYEVLAIENLFEDVSSKGVTVSKTGAAPLHHVSEARKVSKVNEDAARQKWSVADLKGRTSLNAQIASQTKERKEPPSDHKWNMPEKTWNHRLWTKESSLKSQQMARMKESQQMPFVNKTSAARRDTFLDMQRVRDTNGDFSQRKGYNMGKAYGSNRKAPKKFSVRNVVANQASTICYMQIFGTGFDVGDTIPTVLLFFDRRRFIFNVGEGLHRLCMEHKFKLSKIDHVFLTRVCSETTGGLPGLLLTMAEMGDTGYTARTWGPSNLDDLVTALRAFVPSDWAQYTHSFGEKEDTASAAASQLSCPVVLVDDELVKISAVILHPISSSNGPCNEKGSGNMLDMSIRSALSQLQENEAPTPENEGWKGMSVVYICELSKVAGKFDPIKALAKGLKPGYKYGKLQHGESVLSDDGLTTVLPEDVLGPSHPGPIMMLVDCPTLSHIPALITSSSLQSYFSGSGKTVNCMVHISPASITSCKEYQDWMRNFRETQHINTRSHIEELGVPILKSSAMVLAKLNLICPRLFPMIWLDSYCSTKENVDGQTTVATVNLQKFHFRPIANIGLDSSCVQESFNFAAAQRKLLDEIPKIREVRERVADIFNGQCTSNAASENLPECLQGVTQEEMEVVFLGTGSSQPSKHRNVSGIYIHLFKQGGILLDCGEGTYAQLRRRYGALGSDEVLMGLKCIWISHIHADHHLGLTRLLCVRKSIWPRTPYEPILVVGPKSLKAYLDAYQKVEDLGIEFLDCSQTVSTLQEDESTKVGGGFITSSLNSGSSHKKGNMQYMWKQPGFHSLQGNDVAGRKRLQSVLQSLGLKDLQSVPVVHCPHAFGVVLEAQGKLDNQNERQYGWKLVYSGDTRPCQALIKASQGATILIHEATFDDDMPEEAVKKNHSMTAEAIQVGVVAGVYRIFLTHFSQRYPRVPVFEDAYADRTCAAFDMMSVNLADLPLVPKLSPALRMIFKDDDDVEDVEDGEDDEEDY